MGIGHAFKQTQFSSFHIPHLHRYCHGGELRRQRRGRGRRPLSTKSSLHTVFKINRHNLRGRSLRQQQCFLMIHKIIKQYARRFFVKVEQLSIQHDHIHLLIRTTRRSHYHYFFRVVAGQIAQRFEQDGLIAQPSPLPKSTIHQELRTPRTTDLETKLSTSNAGVSVTPRRRLGVTDTPRKWCKGTQLWKYRPFSRVVRGWKAYVTAKNYIKLNELEVQNKIPYRKSRLKGLSAGEWELLRGSS